MSDNGFTEKQEFFFKLLFEEYKNVFEGGISILIPKITLSTPP